MCLSALCKSVVKIIISRSCLLFTFFYLLFGVQIAFSASGYQFRQVSAINALSQSSVLSIVQDSTGFLWIGTKDGLNRFDGYEFVAYKYDPFDENSLSSNEISALCLQSDNYLWIGTRSGGINRLELSSGTFTRFSQLSYDDLIRDIYSDENGVVWATSSEGLLRFNSDESSKGGYFENLSTRAVYRRHTNEPFIPSRINTALTAIYPLGGGKLLVGADGGLFEYDIALNEFRSLSTEMHQLSVITQIIDDSKGNIWVASYDGLVRITRRFGGDGYDYLTFNMQSPPQRRLPVDWVEALVEDHRGKIWVATRGAGLVLVANNTVRHISGQFLPENSVLRDNIINELFIDRTGVLWVGTESNELIYLDLFAKQFRSVLSRSIADNGLSDNLVTAITGSGDKIWIGTAAAGIDNYRFDGKRLSRMGNIPGVILQDGQSKNEITALLRDRDDILWIGSSTNSLVRYTENEGFQNYVVNGFVFTLMEDLQGNIWFGTWGQGIGYINKRTGVVEQYNNTPERMMGLSSDKIQSVYKDSKGYLWVGTKGGGLNVALIDDVIARRGRFTVFRHQPHNARSLSYNDVYDIREDLDGNIWIATGRGLNKLVIPEGKTRRQALADGSAIFEVNSEREGLPGGLVYTIRTDAKGHLWLGTNNGLGRFSFQDRSWSAFDVNDGLPSGKFSLNSAYRDRRTGYMFFGGVDGVTFFHPDSITSNPFGAKVIITGFRLHNRLVLPNQRVNGRRILEKHIYHTNTLNLAHSDRELSFEFSALHYSSPDKIRYAYRLLGFNDEWQETGSDNRRATYTNLKYGEYVFQVRATNNDGVWTGHLNELKIIVHPPIWLTIWAYLLYFSVFMFLLWVFRRYSLIAVTKKNQLIIESMEHRKDTEIAEAKMRFFTNVSHEIRTPLTLIHAPLQQLLSRKDLPFEVQESAEMMNRNLKRLLNQVNQLLELRKMEKGQYKLKFSEFSATELAQEILLEFDAIIRRKQVEVVFDGTPESVIRADRQLISTVFYNLVSNSLKFSPQSGKLSLSVALLADDGGLNVDCIRFKICDNGPGIPADELNNVFERFYQAQGDAHAHMGGSGLGLSIVKEFTELHGGKVYAYNLSGGGCCFEVLIPVGSLSKLDGNSLVSLPVTTYNIDETPKSDKTQKSTSSRNKPVMMVVEDDVDLAAYLKGAFESDYNVHLFFDGAKAYEAVENLGPDIIVCDVMLPGMNGLDFTSRLKQDAAISHIPIILLTARAEEDNLIEGYKVGANSYVTKPFSINVLKAQINSVLQALAAFRNRFSKKMVLEPAEEAITPVDEKFLAKLMEIVEANMANTSFDVSNLVDEMHMSHSIILKKVKSLTGMSPVEFIRTMRIKKAAQIFRKSRMPISEVAFMVGFSDAKYFSKCFTREMGVKPTDFIREHHA